MKNAIVSACLIAALLIVIAGGLGYIGSKQQQQICPVVDTSHLGTLRLTDTAAHTTLIVQVSTGGTFTYMTSNATRYEGGAVSGLTAASQSDMAATCGHLLHLHYQGSAQRIDATAPQNAGPAEVVLDGLVDPVHYGAQVSFQDNTNHESFKSAVQAPPDPLAVVNRYDSATDQGQWAVVASLTATESMGGLTPDQFSAKLATLAQGNHRAASRTIVTQPHVGSNPLGIIFATVTEDVTYSINGTARHQRVVLVYVLENGQWKYWFSKVISQS